MIDSVEEEFTVSAADSQITTVGGEVQTLDICHLKSGRSNGNLYILKFETTIFSYSDVIVIRLTVLITGFWDERA